MSNIHKNLKDSEIHNPKGFGDAEIGTVLVKDLDARLTWSRLSWIDPVIDLVDGALPPPSSSTGDRYYIERVDGTTDANWGMNLEGGMLVEVDSSGLWSGYALADGVTFRSSANGYRSNVVVSSSADTGRVDSCECIKSFKVEVSSAEVLNLFSNPLEIIPAQGAGTYVKIIEADFWMTYNSSAYTTNTSLVISSYLSNLPQFRESTGLNQSSDQSKQFERAISGGGSTALVENDKIVLAVEGGNPASGDSDITIYGTYRVVTL